MSEITFEDVPPQPIRFHEYCDLFPDMTGRQRQEFADDIKERGVQKPIVFMPDGFTILDGKNRYQIARQLGIEYPRVTYTGNDPLGFVIAENLRRRHLTDSQRAMLAGEIAKKDRGRPASSPNGEITMTRARAAELMEVSPRSVDRAKKVLADAAPEVVKAAKSGELPVATAAVIAELPKEQQVEIIKSAGPKALAAVVREAKDKRQSEKKAKRAERESELAGKIKALPDAKFGVILADPPWKFEVFSDATGMDRAAENHYPTQDVKSIELQDVGSIAAKDSVLFLWATVPALQHAFSVMGSWGFKYVSQLVWVKDKVGTGYWFRNMHEILLVGTRGNIPAPAMGEQFPSVLKAKVREHSRKPDEVLEMIEKYYPNLPKIELNRRGPAREGWSSWGLEAE